MSQEAFPTDSPAVVTCGLPYANGDLHIGHLRTYASGDAYARALRTLGQKTAFVSGSDMHGTPVAVNADDEGVSPESFAVRHHERYRETFPEFDIDFDNYGHTHDATNTELTTEFVRTLDEADHIYEKEILVAWDPITEEPLPDRYVEGTCPYCGDSARGDECDAGCGRHLEPGEVEEPRSTRTGNPAEYRERSHKFFRVSAFQSYLQEFIDRLEGTTNAQNQPREWIEGELQDWCITRDLDWGIDYPGEGGEELVLYVWVDAPIEYVSSTRQYSERVGAETFDWERAWQEDGEIVHVIGPDIIQHHTVFWPAMLEAVGYVEPRAVMASGFLTLEERGFSTSRDHAVWADEYLDTGFHTDLLRYYLTTAGGFQQDVDFSWERFRERVTSDLSDTVGNFAYRSLLFATRNYDGSPDATVSEAVRERITEATEAFDDALQCYELKRAGEAAIELAAFGNQYIQQNEPWTLTDDHPERAATVIRDCVQVVKAVCVLLAPFTPEKAQTLWTQIGESGSVHDVGLEACQEPTQETFEEPVELFAKIEADEIEALSERIAADDEAPDSDATSETDSPTPTEADSDAASKDLEALREDRIAFETFQELDLRVGEIVSAEPIEGADDLLCLDVDIGVETRQLVAGLRQLHDVDSLPGTRVIVLANLEQAELFGVTSNGMVLAAGEEADLLGTHGDSPLGTRVQ